MRRRRIVTQRVQGARGTVRRVPGTDRSLRADAGLENDRQENVLPRGEDGVSPSCGGRELAACKALGMPSKTLCELALRGP